MARKKRSVYIGLILVYIQGALGLHLVGMGRMDEDRWFTFRVLKVEWQDGIGLLFIFFVSDKNDLFKRLQIAVICVSLQKKKDYETDQGCACASYGKA